MTHRNRLAARQILEVIPLVMRSLGANLRQDRALAAAEHFRLLFMLTEGPHNLSELAQKHAVSLPTMSKSVSALVERGLIERRQSPDDRRQIVIELSPRGKAILASIKKRAEAVLATRLKEIPAGELDQLLAGLAVLRDAFENSE